MRGGTEEWGRWGTRGGNEGGRLGRREGESDLRDTSGALLLHFCCAFTAFLGILNKSTKGELEQSSLAPLQQQQQQYIKSFSAGPRSP
jgi:hypothetical protein